MFFILSNMDIVLATDAAPSTPEGQDPASTMEYPHDVSFNFHIHQKSPADTFENICASMNSYAVLLLCM